MLFNSLAFFVFFPVVLLVYFIVPEKIKKIWLLFSSYYFYMSWNPQYGLLLAGVTLITYWGGIWIEKNNGKLYAKKMLLAIVSILIFAILFFFKYCNFISKSIVAFLSILGITVIDRSFDIVLPVGISFFTFQSIGYVVDVYRGDKAEKNVWEYALFVSFFPQLVAGPIERSRNLLKQLHRPYKFQYENIREGLLLMTWGYFLKLMVADRAAIYVDAVYSDIYTYSGMYILIATILFAFQVYCDFAGYSIIAMGAARMLGVELMDNFDCPYFSKTVSEFWNRWHISLGSWFRDYLYIPLGGNRKGALKKYVNKMIVFLVSGLWHGANWTFFVWGGVNGLYQIAGEVTQDFRRRFRRVLRIKQHNPVYVIVKILVTFCLIDFSWIFFRANNLKDAFELIRQMIVGIDMGSTAKKLFVCGVDEVEFVILIISLLILMISDFCKYHKVSLLYWILEQKFYFRWIIYLVAFYIIFIFGIWGEGYNAQAFIYFQF